MPICVNMPHYEQANTLNMPNKTDELAVSFPNICHKGANFFILFPYLDPDFFQGIYLPSIYNIKLNIFLFKQYAYCNFSYTY